MPKTKMGKWAMWLIVVFIFFIAILQVFYILTVSGVLVTNTSSILPIVGLTGFVVGIAAFIVGLVSIIISKERSVIVYIAVAIGVFPLIFILGEFLVSH